ncbi:MAG: hypothetical protein FWE69_06660, partial [Clostridiales bacterium]|nr:hypothetical protein [Clostridiales bacterium]
TDPTHAGHTFTGWYLGEAKFDFATPITGDITLKAKWKLRGDADCNGTVSAADAAAILRHLVQLQYLTPQGLINALVTDTTGSTTVSAADAAKILRWLVELVKDL